MQYSPQASPACGVLFSSENEKGEAVSRFSFGLKQLGLVITD